MKNIILTILIILTIILSTLLCLTLHENKKLRSEIDGLSDQIIELESISGLEK